MVKVDVQSILTQEAKPNDESMLKGSVVMGPKPDKSPGYELTAGSGLGDVGNMKVKTW